MGCNWTILNRCLWMAKRYIATWRHIATTVTAIISFLRSYIKFSLLHLDMPHCIKSRNKALQLLTCLQMHPNHYAWNSLSLTICNLVEAHCYGKGMTWQFLSGYVAVKQVEGKTFWPWRSSSVFSIQYCNWWRPSQSKRLTFNLFYCYVATQGLPSRHM